MIHCCKNCVAPRRHLGCHSSCEDYIREKKDSDELRESMKRQKDLEVGLRKQRKRGDWI